MMLELPARPDEESPVAATTHDEGAVERYAAVREHTEALCEPLELEDYVVSSMVDASPTKWHLAHTTWFFETFVLAPLAPWYTAFDDRFAYLFNSYYVQAGERHCRVLDEPTSAGLLARRPGAQARLAALLAFRGGRPVRHRAQRNRLRLRQ
jgi:hypothetical protein